MTFFDKLTAAIQRNRSLLCVGLDPAPDQVPERYRAGSSDLLKALLAWNQAVIRETADLVCAYKPNIAFYEALGEEGMSLLRRTLAVIPDHVPVILDAKRGDIGSTAQAYARACFDVWGVDAVTLSPYLGRDSVEPFTAYPDRGVFVLCHTSNPGAGEFQALEMRSDAGRRRGPPLPLFLHVARTAAAWSPNVGLVVGATYPQALAQVRAVAPDAWLLVPGIGAQGGDLEACLAVGLRPDSMGLIVNVARGVTLADGHRAAAQGLRDAINAAREGRRRPAGNGEAAPGEDDLRALVLALSDLGAVKFGNFTLASGIQSPIYIDLRLLVSRPAVLAQSARAYVGLLADLPCDRIAGVPYAALPIGAAVALATDVPLIYPRKEAKGYGLGRDIEGEWRPGDRVVIIEDLITSGGSTLNTAQRLRAAGLTVEHVIVLIDREQGGVENLARAGITAHSVIGLSHMLDILTAAGRLDAAKHAEVLDFIGVEG